MMRTSFALESKTVVSETASRDEKRKFIASQRGRLQRPWLLTGVEIYCKICSFQALAEYVFYKGDAFPV